MTPLNASDFVLVVDIEMENECTIRRASPHRFLKTEQGTPKIVDGIGGNAQLDLAAHKHVPDVEDATDAKLRLFLIDQSEIFKIPLAADNGEKSSENLVRTAGIEPARPKSRDFKSLASTSFATSA